MQDSFSRQNWKPLYPGNPGCTFVAQGYLLSETAETNGAAIPTCSAPNSLRDLRVMNLLVQVTMNIQRGECGKLAVSSVVFPVPLCADGTTQICRWDTHNNGPCESMGTNAIHQGLGKDNILALEVVAGKNNQVQLITFINGQYIVEQTAYHVEQQSFAPEMNESASLYLSTDFLAVSATPPALTNVLYKDVKVWHVSNPVS